MTPHKLLATTLSATAAFGLTLSACSSSSKSSNDSVTLTGQKFTLTFLPGASQQLARSGVTATADAPATGDLASGIVFPVTGGSISKSNFKGTVKMSGGLTFKSATGSLAFTNPFIDTTSGILSATVQGQTNSVMQITPITVSGNLSAGTATVTGTGGTLASAFTIITTGALGVTPFQENQSIGTVLINLTFKGQ